MFYDIVVSKSKYTNISKLEVGKIHLKRIVGIIWSLAIIVNCYWKEVAHISTTFVVNPREAGLLWQPTIGGGARRRFCHRRDTILYGPFAE